MDRMFLFFIFFSPVKQCGANLGLSMYIDTTRHYAKLLG